MSFYSKAKVVCAGIIRCLFRVRIEGRENEPEDGTFLICSNHISDADPFLIGASLRHNPHFLAKKELLAVPVIGRLLAALGAYPLDRGAADIAALKKTVALLKEGQSVVMFPQGKRCRGENPAQTEVKAGCSLLAVKAGTPVLPILLSAKDFRVRLFRRVTLKIGKPVPLEEILTASNGGTDHRAGAAFLFKRITELMPPESEGKKE